MPPAVESNELLNRKYMYLWKNGIDHNNKLIVAKKHGTPIAINLIQSNVHTPGLRIMTINCGSASKRPIKTGNNKMKTKIIELSFVIKVFVYVLAHTIRYPTNITYTK